MAPLTESIFYSKYFTGVIQGGAEGTAPHTESIFYSKYFTGVIQGGAEGTAAYRTYILFQIFYRCNPGRCGGNGRIQNVYYKDQFYISKE